jgi:hypothetical protein
MDTIDCFEFKTFLSMWISSVRTPMTSISVYVDLLNHDPSDNLTDEQKRNIQVIAESNSRAMGSVEHLFEYWQLRCENPLNSKEDFKPKALQEIFKRAISQAAPWLSTINKNVENIEVDLPDSLPPIRCESYWLERAIRNIFLLPFPEYVSPPINIDAARVEDPSKVLVKITKGWPLLTEKGFHKDGLFPYEGRWAMTKMVLEKFYQESIDIIPLKDAYCFQFHLPASRFTPETPSQVNLTEEDNGKTIELLLAQELIIVLPTDWFLSKPVDYDPQILKYQFPDPNETTAKHHFKPLNEGKSVLKIKYLDPESNNDWSKAKVFATQINVFF